MPEPKPIQIGSNRCIAGSFFLKKLADCSDVDAGKWVKIMGDFGERTRKEEEKYNDETRAVLREWE